MPEYLYFPGCSLKGTGKPYEESLLMVFKELGIKLIELPDWNCCGATSYSAINEKGAFAMAARNIAIASEFRKDMVVPCPNCYTVLNKTREYMRSYKDLRFKIIEALNRGNISYKDNVDFRHPLEILLNEIGPDRIKEKVKKPLNGLKVAPYYGCLLVRPYPIAGEDPRDPKSLDRLIELTGATPLIDFPLKTQCCGGSLTGTIEEVGHKLVYFILKEARRRRADLIVTACPLCQFNLEAYQKKISRKYKEDLQIPILYFTQLLGLAFGYSEKDLGIHRNFVPLRVKTGGIK